MRILILKCFYVLFLITLISGSSLAATSSIEWEGFPADIVNINDQSFTGHPTLNVEGLVKANTVPATCTNTPPNCTITIPSDAAPGIVNVKVKDANDKILLERAFTVLPNISSICPVVGRPKDMIVIKGKGFGRYLNNSYVKIDTTITKITENAITKKANWNDNEIQVVIPNVKGNVDIQVYNSEHSGGIFSNKAGIVVYESDTDSRVDDVIKMKKSGVTDSAIIEYLYNSKECDEGDLKCKGLGIGSLTGSHVEKLKQSGFQDDFISKFQGYKQYVSIGVAPVWLMDTRNYAISPILRILLVPRSYSYEYRPFWINTPICPTGGTCLKFPSGLFQFDRWDLNFGITNTTSTDGQNGNTDRSYILVGASLALNRDALLNIGHAAASGSTNGKDSQAYIGITVDYNILKSLGLVQK